MCRYSYKCDPHYFRLMSFKNYTCTLCGQDFTRKSSGFRHSYNLHRGQAKIARTLEYIIGRLNGQYAPALADPLSYRKRQNVSVITKNIHCVDIAHDSPDPRGYEATSLGNEIKPAKQSYSEIEFSKSAKPVDANWEQSSLTHSKLDEFTLLCGRLLPYPLCEILLKKMEYDLIQNGDKESNLDEYLQLLRTMESIRQPMNKKISNAHAPLSEHQYLFDLPSDVKIKLEKIKHALNSTRCFHPATVYELVEHLGNKYKDTGLSIIDEALSQCGKDAVEYGRKLASYLREMASSPRYVGNEGSQNGFPHSNIAHGNSSSSHSPKLQSHTLTNESTTYDGLKPAGQVICSALMRSKEHSKSSVKNYLQKSMSRPEAYVESTTTDCTLQTDRRDSQMKSTQVDGQMKMKILNRSPESARTAPEQPPSVPDTELTRIPDSPSESYLNNTGRGELVEMSQYRLDAWFTAFDASEEKKSLASTFKSNCMDVALATGPHFENEGMNMNTHSDAAVASSSYGVQRRQNESVDFSIGSIIGQYFESITKSLLEQLPKN